MSKALVVGGAGFIGRHVCRELLRSQWKVLALDGAAEENAGLPGGTDYRRMELPDKSFERLLCELQPDALVHCAGRASVSESSKDPHEDFLSHVVLTEWLLATVGRLSPVCRVIYLSSAAVYGQPGKLPIEETETVNPLSPYGYHKRMAELLCEQASKLRGLPTAVARVFSAYGPGLRRQVVWEACAQAIENGQIALAGSGNETRDFIHAADIGRAVALLASKAPAKGEVYNIASGREIFVREVAEKISSLAGSSHPIFQGLSRPGDPEKWCADISKIAGLGFEPAIDFDFGLKAVFDWVRAEKTIPA